MEFSAWLVANEFDAETLTPAQKSKLQAQWRAETNPPSSPPTSPPTVDTPPTKVEGSGFEAEMQAIERENERIDTIRKMTVQACNTAIGNPQKVQQLRAMCDAAVADDKTSVKDFQLALLRAGRFDGPLIMPSGSPQITESVVEAAFCRRAGLENLEQHFDERTLDAADKHFKRGLGMQSLMALVARQNGWRGADVSSAIESRDFWRAAWGGGGDGFGLHAGTTGPSTYSLPNVFSNAANKFLKTGFMAVESVWRRISSRRSVNDFKTITSLALSGSMMYKKLAPSGEIKHGDLRETTYTNKADTYAIMFGISRTDLINDDLGALSTVGRRIGRGAALKINDVFWTVFLNNSSFFTSGNANVSTGGGSALGTAEGAAINAAEVKFKQQTDPDGLPLAIMPKIMLVPSTLMNTAARWMGSQVFTLGGTAGLGATNIFGGRYTVESSAYMENSAYTGNSTAAWYLLADPQDMPVIEVVFLNGKESPTVESAEADFNQLGIAMRGYVDFGVNLQEYRGGVRSAGS